MNMKNENNEESPQPLSPEGRRLLEHVFMQTTGLRAPKLPSDHQQTVGLGDAVQQKEYETRSFILNRLRKAETTDSDDRAAVCLDQVQRYIASVYDDMAALRFTDMFIEVCRKRGFVLELEGEGELELDPDILEQLRKKQMSQKQHLEHLAYLLKQAYCFKIDACLIEEEMAAILSGGAQ